MAALIELPGCSSRSNEQTECWNVVHGEYDWSRTRGYEHSRVNCRVFYISRLPDMLREIILGITIVGSSLYDTNLACNITYNRLVVNIQGRTSLYECIYKGNGAEESIDFNVCASKCHLRLLLDILSFERFSKIAQTYFPFIP